ncbi:MAG: 3-oxoadipate enol-lactonase, partial [Casimicrobiaceae bacterium]
MASSFIEFSGVRFHYRIEGPAQAPALVLSNSLGTDLTMWDPQIAELTRHFRVLRYDTRGHGQSTASLAPYSVEQLGRDVLGLLDVVGIERAHFCGLSLGGMTGMWLAAHEGWRIQRLVLANTTARMAKPELYDTRIAKVRQEGVGAIVGAVIERWFTAPFIAEHPDAITPIRTVLERQGIEGYVGGCTAVRDMDQRASIATITRPTLVIAGTHDAATPLADGQFIAQTIPNARFVELPAAHLSNIEAAPQFTAAVLEFL